MITPVLFRVSLHCIMCLLFFHLVAFYMMGTLLVSCPVFNLSTEKCRSSRPEVFLVKGVLKICNKFTGEQPCQSVISIKLQCNFIEVTLRHECSPVNLLHIFRPPFTKNTSGWLLLLLRCLIFSINGFG